MPSEATHAAWEGTTYCGAAYGSQDVNELWPHEVSELLRTPFHTWVHRGKKRGSGLTSLGPLLD